MAIPARIHVLGASGSGTTSIGALLSAKHGHRHVDTDDFYWLPTDPPFQEARPPGERLTLLRSALDESSSWVLSGSLCGWGDPLISEFDLVMFLVVPTEVRLARLRAREMARYGREAVAPGGLLHATHVAFLNWAERYDTGDLEVRSRARHEAWLSNHLSIDGASVFVVTRGVLRSHRQLSPARSSDNRRARQP